MRRLPPPSAGDLQGHGVQAYNFFAGGSDLRLRVEVYSAASCLDPGSLGRLGAAAVVGVVEATEPQLALIARVQERQAALDSEEGSPTTDWGVCEPVEGALDGVPWA